jgi:hypothetical protein
MNNQGNNTKRLSLEENKIQDKLWENKNYAQKMHKKLQKWPEIE